MNMNNITVYKPEDCGRPTDRDRRETSRRKQTVTEREAHEGGGALDLLFT